MQFIATSRVSNAYASWLLSRTLSGGDVTLPDQLRTEERTVQSRHRPRSLPLPCGGKCRDSTSKRYGLDRLGQVAVEACGDRALAVLGVRAGGHRRDRHAVPECAFERTDLSQNRVPVAGGHRDVAEHEVGREFSQRIDGGARRQRGTNGGAVPSQRLEHHLARFAIVVDDRESARRRVAAHQWLSLPSER